MPTVTLTVPFLAFWNSSAILELLGDRFGDRENGARTVDLDHRRRGEKRWREAEGRQKSD